MLAHWREDIAPVPEIRQQIDQDLIGSDIIGYSRLLPKPTDAQKEWRSGLVPTDPDPEWLNNGFRMKFTHFIPFV